MSRGHVGLGLLCLAAAATLLGVPSESRSGEGAAVHGDEVSPHGNPDLCADCHAPFAPGTPLEAIVWTHGTADDTCRHCHEGAAPHEGGLGPADPEDKTRAELPPDWPTVAGKLACLTCHDEPACDGKAVDPENVRFFRGGPYATVGELCARCHTVEQLGSYNPHEAMVERLGSTSVCEFCHQSAEVTEADREDLAVAAPRMCAGCHREDSVHAGAPVHLVTLDAAGLERARAAGLPLDQDRVFCGTCHDPHPAASLEERKDRLAGLGRPLVPEGWSAEVLVPTMADRAASRGAVAEPRVAEPDYLRRPLAGGDLCRVCHLPADIDADPVKEDPP